MLSRENKKLRIGKFESHVEKAQIIIVSENLGLTAEYLSGLRNKVRQCDDGCTQVVKNTLAKIVLKGRNFEVLSEHLKGPLIYSTGSDSVSIAKVLAKESKANPNLVIRGGALANGIYLDVDQILYLSTLPGRQELLAKLCSTMQAPIAGFVRTLNAIPESFVRALAAIRDQKEDS